MKKSICIFIEFVIGYIIFFFRKKTYGSLKAIYGNPDFSFTPDISAEEIADYAKRNTLKEVRLFEILDSNVKRVHNWTKAFKYIVLVLTEYSNG